MTAGSEKKKRVWGEMSNNRVLRMTVQSIDSTWAPIDCTGRRGESGERKHYVGCSSLDWSVGSVLLKSLNVLWP